jgi:predicted SnoaL-like aldol condensation-catalyzing enzyme
MSETNKDIVVAFYKRALFEGQVEDAFRLYAVPTYRQHNPLDRRRHGRREEVRCQDHGESSGCSR